MDQRSPPSLRVDYVFCKCGEGWTGEITKTDGPNSGKSFLKCGDDRTCEITDLGECAVTEGSLQVWSTASDLKDDHV